MGKLNFRVYLISWFYLTRKIRENLMHAKNVLHYIYVVLDIIFGISGTWNSLQQYWVFVKSALMRSS